VSIPDLLQARPGSGFLALDSSINNKSSYGIFGKYFFTDPFV
jgi:hypothetical protein